MNIWVCIPVFNRIDFTMKCLATLKVQTFENFTVVICDHGSTDGTSARIKQGFPDVVVLNADSSLWWTGAMNRCVGYVLKHADGNDSLLTLNNDTELPPDYLAEFAAYMSKYPHAILTSVPYDIVTGQRLSVGYRQNWLTARAKVVTFEQDHLPGDEMLSADGRTDRHEAIGVFDAEFSDTLFQADIGLGEMFTLRLGNVLLLGFARAELNREIAIAVSGAVRYHLAIFQRENGHRHMPSILLEEAGHPDFLCDHAGAHRHYSSTEAPADHPQVRVRPQRQAPQPHSARIVIHRPVRAECSGGPARAPAGARRGTQPGSDPAVSTLSSDQALSFSEGSS